MWIIDIYLDIDIGHYLETAIFADNFDINYY